ncbi:MAG: F0F1 ATP synthase subunit B' [Hyphomicrobiaceae bacterium]|nr:F0F1 ATP synthase subunit B' [Hyphomicrobiaceae bacterium]
MLASLAVLAAATAEATEQSGGLPQLYAPDFAPQLIWLAITFGALYFILSRWSLPRVAEVIEERRDRIQRDLDEADRLKGETEKALAAYEQELAAARGRAGSIARETRDKLAAEVDQERARADSQVNAKLEDAEKRIGQMKSKALAQVNEIATETAGAVVEKLIGAEVSAEEARRALEPVPGE